jgi:hypothetical protein
MRAVVALGVAVTLAVALGVSGAHTKRIAPDRETVAAPTPTQTVSIPRPSGPVVVGLPLAGTDASAPASVDALAVLEAGVESTTHQVVEPSRVELVANGPDTLTCLVGVSAPTGAPVLATAERVGGRWSFVGVQ